MIEALGVTGPPMSWPEQFEYRYLLSIDGNGATCSRVSIALASNSALVKYASNFLLYFFKGMTHGREFFEVQSDQDVLTLLEVSDQQPELVKDVADGGAKFASAYLSRISTMYYLDRLMRHYFSALGAELQSTTHAASFLIDALGVFDNGKLLRGGLNGWLGGRGTRAPPLRGFKLEAGPELSPEDLGYQGVLSDGSRTPRHRAGEMCGPSQGSAALSGVIIHLDGVAAEAFQLSYELAFEDGASVGPVPAGEVAASESGSRIVGLQLTVSERPPPVDRKRKGLRLFGRN